MIFLKIEIYVFVARKVNGENGPMHKHHPVNVYRDHVAALCTF
jgi:hypothetical protein